MRQKIIYDILIFFSLLFFFSGHFVYSQTPTPILSIPVPLPGVNCGKLYDPQVDPNIRDYNLCCYNKPIAGKFIDWGSIPVLSAFTPVTDFINNLLRDKLTPLLELQRQVIVEPCVIGVPSTPGNPGDQNCKCVKPTNVPLTSLQQLCNEVRTEEKGDCLNCIGVTGTGGTVGVWTGLGCIYTNPEEFIKKTVFGLLIGLAGVISLLCIIYAAFMMQTSQGNPEKIKKAQELLTSCIMGLMLIIFSVFILKLIGVDILRIPGLSK